MTRFLLVGAFVWGSAVQAQVAGVEIAGALVAGQQVSVTWTGPNGQNDWVGVAETGAAGSSWVPGSWAYTSAGNPVAVTLPGNPGTYEMRYVTGGSAILAAQTIAVTAPAGAPAAPSGPIAATASLQPTGALIGGVSLAVGWTGPNGQGDWIGLAPPGGSGSAWVGTSYAYTNSGNPVSVALPIDGGSFELRYVTGANVVLASIPVTVIAGTLPSVNLSPMTAPEGAALSIPLGPDAPRAGGDYLYIAPAGAPPGDYSGGYVTVPAEGPVQINAPATAGEWEMRYVVTRSGQYIPVGSAPLTVTGALYKTPRGRP
ncbi:MAG: hypothetical protein KDK12_07280 [Rhodobacteraceae bacterium]|nr:hypothetical protein [Paracoccaceae bacterium]